MTPEQHDMLLALELVRRALSDNAAAVVANTRTTEDDYRKRAEAIGDFVAGGRPLTPGDRSPAGDVAHGPGGSPGPRGPAAGRAPATSVNPLVSAMGMLTARFAAIVGPAAVLAQILQSTGSGFGVLQQSVRLFAATLAPVLIPATLGLSVLFIGLSEIVMEHADLTERLIERGMQWLTVLEVVLDMFDSAADHVEELSDAADQAERAILDFAAAAYLQAQKLNPFTSDEEDAAFTREHFTPRGRGGEGGDEGEGAGRDRVDRGLRDALQSLRMSMGPRGTVGGVEDVGRQVQLAALNADPIEARMLKVQQDMLERLERIAANTRDRRRGGRVYDPGPTGAGDYERGAEAGGGGDYGEE